MPAPPAMCLQSHQDQMDFTIIRPGGLKSEPGTGTGVLAEDPGVCGAIHREDVADLVIKALFSPKAANKVPCSTGVAGWTC